jgi:hypothetical protein
MFLHDLRTPIANAILETYKLKKKLSPMKNENATHGESGSKN